VISKPASEAAKWMDGIACMLMPEAQVSVLYLLAHGYLNDLASMYLTPILSTHLAGHVKDLYPMPCVMAYSAVMVLTSGIDNNNNNSQQQHSMMSTFTLQGLHRLLDGCRELLLVMYSNDEAYVKQREGWSGLVNRSTKLDASVFVHALIAMSSCATRDVALYLSLLEKCVPERWLTSPRGLEASLLVPLVMSAVEQCSPRYDPPTDKHLSDDRDHLEVANSTSSPHPKDIRRRILTPLLNAVWGRTEELNSSDVHALLRCLKFHFGDDAVDVDLKDRLKRHLDELDSQRASTKTSSSLVKSPEPHTPSQTQGASAPPLTELDSFELMELMHETPEEVSREPNGSCSDATTADRTSDVVELRPEDLFDV